MAVLVSHCHVLHDPSSLSICISCQALRCFSCLSTTIVIYYCPSCLQTVFTRNANAQQACCARCLACPRCGSKLELEEKNYACTGCNYTFGNATAYANESDWKAVYERTQTALKDRKCIEKNVFDALVDAYTNNIRESDPADIDQLLSDHDKISEETEFFDTEVYSAMAFPDKNLLPVPVPLHSKLAHNCPTCNRQLIQPMFGASSVGFDIHESFYEYAPSIALRSLPSLEGNPTYDRLEMRVRNLSSKILSISLHPYTLDIPDHTRNFDDNVRLLNRCIKPAFPNSVLRLPAYNEELDIADMTAANPLPQWIATRNITQPIAELFGLSNGSFVLFWERRNTHEENNISDILALEMRAAHTDTSSGTLQTIRIPLLLTPPQR